MEGSGIMLCLYNLLKTKNYAQFDSLLSQICFIMIPNIFPSTFPIPNSIFHHPTTHIPNTHVNNDKTTVKKLLKKNYFMSQAE